MNSNHSSFTRAFFLRLLGSGLAGSLATSCTSGGSGGGTYRRNQKVRNAVFDTWAHRKTGSSAMFKGTITKAGVVFPVSIRETLQSFSENEIVIGKEYWIDGLPVDPDTSGGGGKGSVWKTQPVTKFFKIDGDLPFFFLNDYMPGPAQSGSHFLFKEKLSHVTWQLNGGVRRINGKNYSTALLTGEHRSGFGDDVTRTSMWWSGEVPGGCVRTTSTEYGTSMLDRDKEFVKKEVKRFGAFRIFEMPTILDVSLASFT